jgi:hypothetical protein
MRTSYSPWLIVSIILAGAGCASSPPEQPGPQEAEETAPAAAVEPRDDIPRQSGRLRIDIAGASGAALPARVDLASEDRATKRLHLSKGSFDAQHPVGHYTAYIHVYNMSLPVLVDIQEVTVREEGLASLTYTLYEGATEQTPLGSFDADGDLVLDRVEAAAGTSHHDPASFPGSRPLDWDDPVLSEEEGWLRGELFARSEYGDGAQSVAEAIRRAEKLGLDFLAIADPNTMASIDDPAYHSDSVVLIPAMAWGNDQRGWALIYGPRSLPEPATTVADGQGVCWRAQAQGGVFAVAHPCFPTGVWQWNIQYVNAVQVWCREWSRVPPISLDALHHSLKLERRGEYVYSIARAAHAADRSANGQAAAFWDSELSAGLQACVIGGSGTGSRKIPMAQPATYVYAQEKSVRGILDGIRSGRTFVSSRPEGPTILLRADVMREESADAGAVKDWRDAFMGMTVPAGLPTELVVLVENAKGKTLDVLQNGSIIASTKVDSDGFGFTLDWSPTGVNAVRARVTEPNLDDRGALDGFGFSRVLALSSPIYSQPMLYVDPEKSPEDYRIRLRNEFSYLQPVTGHLGPDGKMFVQPQGESGRHYIAPYDMPWAQPGAEVQTIRPQFYD